MPKGKKHTPEQIVGILRRIEGGEAAQAVCRAVNIEPENPMALSTLAFFAIRTGDQTGASA